MMHLNITSRAYKMVQKTDCFTSIISSKNAHSICRRNVLPRERERFFHLQGIDFRKIWAVRERIRFGRDKAPESLLLLRIWRRMLHFHPTPPHLLLPPQETLLAVSTLLSVHPKKSQKKKGNGNRERKREEEEKAGRMINESRKND